MTEAKGPSELSSTRWSVLQRSLRWRASAGECACGARGLRVRRAGCHLPARPHHLRSQRSSPAAGAGSDDPTGRQQAPPTRAFEPGSVMISTPIIKPSPRTSPMTSGCCACVQHTGEGTRSTQLALRQAGLGCTLATDSSSASGVRAPGTDVQARLPPSAPAAPAGAAGSRRPRAPHCPAAAPPASPPAPPARTWRPRCSRLRNARPGMDGSGKAGITHREWASTSADVLMAYSPRPCS